MESKKRTLIRALTYRALSTAILAVTSWVFTSNAIQTTVITLVFTILATLGYYVHERGWNKISWETNGNQRTADYKSSLNYE